MTSTQIPLTLSFDSEQANLPLVGGKGANLSRLVQAGYPVPDGFFVTTQAYRDFIISNQLAERIQALLVQTESDAPEMLKKVSKQIRTLFSAGVVPDDLAERIKTAYHKLNPSGDKALAVRSSATAEDLPDMSFAGQQDTYLNVIGLDNLQKAVVDCWSSLWTARAIGYRARNDVPHSGVALAVVVQEMVESQASGVLFTANPLTGLRTETVIDATLGLGEALVSGQVEPDNYIVSPGSGEILSKTLGAKEVSIHGQMGGGTQVTRQARGTIQALPDEQILDLARLGRQVEGLYGFPQDIEWAWANHDFYLLQARPVTALFPLPEGLPVEPLKVFFSFAAVQGILDPITPLGQDTLSEIFAAGAQLFGIRVTRKTQTALCSAGERLWIQFTPVLSNSVGRRVMRVVFELVEPSIRQALEEIRDDPRLQPVRPGISWGARRKIARFLLPLAANVLFNLVAPRRRRAYIVDNGERILKVFENQSETIQGDRWSKLAQQADLLPTFTQKYFPNAFRLFVSAVAAGMASWNILNMLARKAAESQDGVSSVDVRDLVLQITRGMPYNPTTEMDLTLWEMAQTIRRDPASLQVIQDYSTAELSSRFLSGELPEIILQTVHQFLQQYGGRGLGEIDLGRPRWADDPVYVFEMLTSYLKIENEEQAPDVVFARGVDSANQAVAQLASATSKMPRGWIMSRLVRFLAGRARQLMGARESPKFFAVRMFWIIQRALLATGAEFVRAGDLNSPDDLFYLTLSELKAFASRQEQDWRSLILGRRQVYQREFLRKQIPRLLLSDGRAFYEGMNAGEASEGMLVGSPVSPGSVEGRVRVVFDPTQAGLEPGEILVCPGTDPSWTPLFLSAGGLVMEVGGMMTHGAVVAREYGIPAIVGVHQATSRLHTGQLIRIDGSNGQILILDDQSHAG